MGMEEGRSLCLGGGWGSGLRLWNVRCVFSENCLEE
jgi:hypothetical protein